MILNDLLQDLNMAHRAFNLFILTRVNMYLEVPANGCEGTVLVVALELHVLAVLFVLNDLRSR